MSIPGSAHPLFLGASGQATGYRIERSLRFNSSDSAHLTRTPGSASDRQRFSLSFWAKNPSDTGAITTYFASGSDTNINETIIGYWDGLYVQNVLSGVTWRVRTNALFRDPSAWYHLVFAFDLSNATQANRMKIYANGLEVTYVAADGNPLPSTANSQINNNVVHYVGRRHFSATNQATNAYLADIHFIDGQALTPSSFGETDTNGVWQPKAYTGSYGTNGFRLPFSDNSAATATTLGKDSAGSNNWTPNNLSVTAGAGNDSLVDSPTNYGTDTGAGGQVRGNYCTWNPLAKGISGSGLALSNGNLDGLTPSNAICSVLGTIGVASGKWYWEITPTADGATAMIGVGFPTANLESYAGSNSNSWGYYGDGSKYFGNTGSAYGATYGNGDVIGVALNMDAGTVTFYKNGTSQGTAFSGLTGTVLPMMGDGGTIAAVAWNTNFGQRPFAYTAPSGFKALTTANLPTPTIANGATAMDAKLYTGNGSTQTISGLGFSPDLVWIKSRSLPLYHFLTDTVRGNTKTLSSNTIDNEAFATETVINSFDSSGFTLNADDGAGYYGWNQNGASQVAWTWDAGTSTVTNTSGSISSQVRANASAGFSIVTWTGNSANATIGHGLGIAPRMVIIKYRGTTDYWYVYHANTGAGQYLVLNNTGASASSATIWQNTAPTSSVFYIGSGNNHSTVVAYCFAPVAGYSAFGSYVGNGLADGVFTYLGFLPKLILIKRTDTTSNWTMLDTSREGYNVDNDPLYPNLSDAEGTTDLLDITSNGFKLRTTDASVNASAGTYIFAAWASNPFQYSRAR